MHDAAAAADGGGAYLFGGGEPSHDEIVHVSPGSAPRVVARLPAPASDVAAARLGGSFYVVGGYTGTQPLDTIVRWRAGSARGRVVAHLPKPLRYAAVATVGHEARHRRRDERAGGDRRDLHVRPGRPASAGSADCRGGLRMRRR